MFSHVCRRVNAALHAGSWHARMRLFGITHIGVSHFPYMIARSAYPFCYKYGAV